MKILEVGYALLSCIDNWLFDILREKIFQVVDGVLVVDTVQFVQPAGSIIACGMRKVIRSDDRITLPCTSLISTRMQIQFDRIIGMPTAHNVRWIRAGNKSLARRRDLGRTGRAMHRPFLIQS
jgi:hypothetical protein